MRLACAVALAALASAAGAAEEAAPPPNVGWQARIAPESEPGEPLVVAGQVFDADGRTPRAGVLVYAYQTDINGVYSPSGALRPPRLQGWAKTDAEGRYALRTIKPAPYPGGGVPAHIHFVLSGRGHGRQEDELQFEGADYVTPAMVEASRRAGRFGGIRPLTRGADGVWRCTYDLRLREGAAGR